MMFVHTRCENAVIVLAGAIAAMMSVTSSAQPYPSKPIRIVVPLAAGGTGDTLGRLAAEKLGEAFGQPTVVDNRAGANGIIGTDLVAKATSRLIPRYTARSFHSTPSAT
jgi:tripartite-type tricarboxylate transporter receptor subunit TctC